MARWLTCSTALWTCALILPPATAQTAPSPPAPAPSNGADFAPPVRLECDGAPVGATRLYPSPVMHDVDGDGLADLVLGDLTGRLTVSLRRAGDVATSFGRETPMRANDGAELKFENW